MLGRVTIVGVGNKLFGDDGAGTITVEVFGKCFKHGNVRFLSFETLDTSVLHVFEESELLVFVDAVTNIDEPRLYIVDPESAREEIVGMLRPFDPHHLDPMRLTILAYASGKLKSKVYLVGVPAKSLELGSKLSDETLKAIPKAVELLVKLLSRELSTPPDIDWRCITEKLNLAMIG